MAVSAIVVFFSIHLMIALVMVFIGSVYHIDNTQYAGLTRDDINSVPSLTIAVGILMIIFMIGSCVIRNMYNKEGYIMMSLLLLVIQLAAGVHGCIKVSDKNGALNATIQEDMKRDIALFYKHNDSRYICHIIVVQEKWHCCGVNSPLDYNISQLPASCCPEQVVNATFCSKTDERYKNGCAPEVYDLISHNSGIVAYVTIVLSIIQIFAILYITAKLTGIDQSLTQETTNYHNF